MGNNILMAIVIPIVTLGLAMFFATLVTIGGSTRGNVKGLRNSSFYRVISFFPYVIPAIVIGLIWSQIYDPSAGLLNGILTRLGLEQFTSFAWLGDPRTARWAVMFVIIWGLVGFYMVLFIAAIKGVPAEVFEAARIDGAGRFRTAVSITIPLIRENVQTPSSTSGSSRLMRSCTWLPWNRVAVPTTRPLSWPNSFSPPRSPRGSSGMPARWVSCSRSSPWRTRVWCSE